MTGRQSNVTLTNQDVCLSVTSLNDNVARSIDLHQWIKLVGLKWSIKGKSVASVNISGFRCIPFFSGVAHPIRIYMLYLI